MTRSPILAGTLAALLLGSASFAVAAPGHTGVGVGGTGPRASSPSFTPPTNPNTRSGNALGQPSQSCQTVGVEPGNAAGAPGSAFNEPSANSLGGTGGQHYAGNVPQSQKNTASVAQYDVACANAAAHGH